MKPSTAERFRGMRWLFLRNNADTYSNKRGVSEVRARPIFDTMVEVEDQTPESLLAETFLRVAGEFPENPRASGHAVDSEFLQEVKERKKLKKWREGRTYRESMISALPEAEKKIINSQLTDPQLHKESVRMSAERRLQSIFEPGVWAQLQDIKRASQSDESTLLSLLPKLKSRSSTHRNDPSQDQSDLPCVTRRQQYGRWYLQPKDWNSKFRRALEEKRTFGRKMSRT